MENQLISKIEELGMYEEDDDECEEPVVLGFVENPKHKWSLLRQLFPSKAGGVPAWLDPVDLPMGTLCGCDICDMPLQFLLQIYAPLFHKETTFHRILYVFVCTSGNCLVQQQLQQQKDGVRMGSKSVKVFRCQLPRLNAYYSPDPPKQDGTDKPTGSGAVLCDWCGCWKGDIICSGCHKAHYCSEIHRTNHRSSGHHESECSRINSLSLTKSLSAKTNPAELEIHKAAAGNALWAEKEIIQEDEEESESDNDSSQNNNGIDSSYIPNDGLDDDSTDAFMEALEADYDKKSWAAFQECIAKAPEQVLRYCRSGSSRPLWPMSSGRPSKADIPNCGYCGGGLIYEFQILPQLLYLFGVQNDANSIDFETIAVYTCEGSCDLGPSYKEEFSWLQLSSQLTVNP